MTTLAQVVTNNEPVSPLSWAVIGGVFLFAAVLLYRRPRHAVTAHRAFLRRARRFQVYLRLHRPTPVSVADRARRARRARARQVNPQPIL